MNFARGLHAYIHVPDGQDEDDLDTALPGVLAEGPEWPYVGIASSSSGNYIIEDKDAARLALQRVSRTAMCVSLAILVFEGIAYNAVYLNKILPAIGGGAYVISLSFIFNSLWFMTIWCYLQAHVMSAGTIPQQWRDFVRITGKDLFVLPPRPEWQPGIATGCKKCGPRPERAHHCAVCDTCLLRMDHHCPWINNCVGFGNHKVFLLLAVYACLASACGLLTSAPAVGSCIQALISVEEAQIAADGRVPWTDATVFLLFCIIDLVAALGLLSISWVHGHRAIENVTSIEEHFDNMPNPFDHGSMWSNLEQVFGTFGPDWFFPIASWRPVADGVAYVTPGEYASLGFVKPGHRSMNDERLWRMRYRARAAVPEIDDDRVWKASPVAFLTSWWKGNLCTSAGE